MLIYYYILVVLKVLYIRNYVGNNGAIFYKIEMHKSAEGLNMWKIVLITYLILFLIYSRIYHVDYGIRFPYTPFKLKEPKSIFSKKLFICRDRRRGMVNITFYAEMIAHVLLVILSVFLLFVYFNGWHNIESFVYIYKWCLLILALLFTIPLIIAEAIHDHMIKKNKLKKEKSGNNNKEEKK